MEGTRNIREWAAFTREIRRFFEDRGFTEVTTNCLVPSGAFEANLDTLQVGLSDQVQELHTSPEFAMKALLADNPIPIFQICPCFRDDPLETGIHLKEFLMLEFYRPHADYNAILGDTKALFSLLAGQPLNFKQRSLKEFSHLEGEDFFRAIVETLEPSLDPETPTIVRDFPPSQCTLYKEGERFEIYWKGMELCNGGSELTDVTELRLRWKKENAIRAAQGKPPHREPQVLFEALEKGLVPCAGIAIGLNRLFKALKH